MANSNIAQTFDSVKTLSSKKQYLEGFSQADYDPARYDMSGQLRSKLEKAIMDGTNEQAFAILSAVDVIDHIPGAGGNFVPLNGFAKFYGVSEEYLKGVLNRHRFLQKVYPEDVRRVYRSEITKNKDIPLSNESPYWKVPGRDDLVRYRLSDSYGAPCVNLPKKEIMFWIYSPRIVLATALALLYTDKSGGNCTAKRVALAIKRSSYRIIPTEPEPKLDEQESMPIPEDGIKMSANGDVVLSKEVIEYLVRAAVKEAINELKTAVIVSHTNKPDAWDDILTKWKYGKLTTHKAAKLAGMSVKSFQEYASGKKTFIA